MKKEYKEQTEEIIKDVIEVAAKTTLSVIPIGGTLITCVWDSVKACAAQKRLDEWKNAVEIRLSKLETSIESVGKNELFASTIMRATEAALKTAESEKRDYLANAVFNSVDADIDESIAMIFLDLLDRYTVWHIRLLNYFNNPSAFSSVSSANYRMGSALQPLLHVYPELDNQKELIRKLIKDTQGDGMIAEGDFLGTIMTGQGMIASRTTNLGRDFLEFISGKD